LHRELRNAHLQRLVCIIFLCSSDDERKNHWPASDDLRFVTIAQENFWVDWQRGILTGKDYWTLAEAFIAAKRAEQIRSKRSRPPLRTAFNFTWSPQRLGAAAPTDSETVGGSGDWSTAQNMSYFACRTFQSQIHSLTCVFFFFAFSRRHPVCGVFPSL
jgi:hypothetical protein